jgi:hypothetical protein
LATAGDCERIDPAAAVQRGLQTFGVPEHEVEPAAEYV